MVVDEQVARLDVAVKLVVIMNELDSEQESVRNVGQH